LPRIDNHGNGTLAPFRVGNADDEAIFSPSLMITSFARSVM
jgi:hypothetical protein